MRIILYTGKGGVGKTSIAAMTAILSAKEGKKTLVMSTDPAHSLGDSFDINLSSEPCELSENLWAMEIDSNTELQKGWGIIQNYIKELVSTSELDSFKADELITIPGLEDLLSLIRILDFYKNNSYDVIIIDCAPTGETLSLLSYPEMMNWWMEKLFPIQRKAAKMLKPIAKPVLGISLPEKEVFDEIQKLYDNLNEIKSVFCDRETTSIRIVVNPEKMVIKEAQRSFTYLNIFNFNVDCIIVNKIMPDNVSDSYFGAWKEIQSKYINTIKESFSPLPIYYAPLMENEVVGMEMLNKFGNVVFKDENVSEIKFNFKTQEISKDENGYMLSVYMPFVEKQDVSLSQKGDELLIKIGSFKRSITLPRTLINSPVKSAKFEDNTLIIIFGGEKNV